VHANERKRILEASAEAYAGVALANIQREFPASAPYVITGPGPLPLPRERHPSFYGSLDWHSCVEMHWVLARLLRLFPAMSIAADVRRVLDDHFAADKLETEAAYFARHRGFERPYGWGWLLTLADELARSPDTAAWSQQLKPLVDVIRAGFLAWLPKATYPQRTGVHGNSAFALLLALDFAHRDHAAGDPALLTAISDATSRWYANDAGYAAHFEPSGSDFLSPGLTEAALMARLANVPFAPWLERFIRSWPDALMRPAVVTDPTDGQIAHLHGLNLSRAYCMRLIRDALPRDDARLAVFDRSISAHAEASLPFVVGSDYMVEHWLAAYAVLLLS